MLELDSQNLNFYWCTKFVRVLYEQGVRKVVISPGSRSTSLTLAFAAHPGFKKYIIIDERSAAFTALGIGKGSGVPACLVCTSGTAVANYLPAVVEASQSGVPLIVLSADRPPQLREIGASQTIDQLKIFGNYPRFFHEVGEPKNNEHSITRLEHSAIQAVSSAIQKCGVSHLNFPFSKPFEPHSSFLNKTEKENEKHAKQTYHSYNVLSRLTKLDEHFWSDIIASEYPLLIGGPNLTKEDIDSILRLAKVLNAPILVEPGSNLPKTKYNITTFDGFLRNETVRKSLTPDLILRFGDETVSKAIHNYLVQFKDCNQIRFINQTEHKDETLSSNNFVSIYGSLEIPEVSGTINKEWLKSWRKYQKNYILFKENKVKASTPITDGFVFKSLPQLIPTDSFMMVSNSFPIRDLALFGDVDGKEVYVNRGAAGIDGITSTAIGLSIAKRKTGVLFIGDIAFLHDTNALLNANQVVDTLIIVILNNGGGTIFRMLPINEYKGKYTNYFETPHSVSIAALCRAYKINHNLVFKHEQLEKDFSRMLKQPGLQILECITDADDSMKLRNQCWGYSETKES